MNRFLFALFFIFYSLFSFSQDFLQDKDLSQFKANQFSDEQLIQISKELKAKQMTLEQVEPLVLAKGMSMNEFIKFKARIQALPQASNEVKKDTPDNDIKKNDVVELAKKNTVVFGSELFTTKSLSFEPNQNMPTAPNYILGPGDQIELVLYGVQQFNHTSYISKNGTINIPNVGDVFISGLTFEAAKSKLKKQISSIYSTLSSNSSKLSVSVANYRTILVTIIGAQQSGNYRLSAMSTVYNALHVAGGPNEIGSYRKIELIRNNKVIRQIDLYQFLTKGNQSDNISLEDNDIVRIPSYDARVVLEGEIKHPGIYELLGGESLKQIISYASGFTENAYKNRILVKQKTASELKVTDLNELTFAGYIPKSGDVINVDKILDRYENRVQIKGAVYRPGVYSLLPNQILTVKKLIEKADGLKENVYLQKASIVRQKEDLTKEYISINLQAAINEKPEANLALQKEDVLLIFYNQELLDSYKISIDGEVRSPGSYAHAAGMSLYDLLLEAEYFTDKAASKITIYRNKKDPNFNPNDLEKIVSFDLNVDPKNPEVAEKFLLEPLDRVVVRRIVTYETPEMVQITGEVLYPGSYAIIKKDERIIDFIARAGGFTDEADLNALKIIRKKALNSDELSKIESKNNIENTTNQTDLNKKNIEITKEVSIPIEWNKLQKNKNTSSNILLEPNDNIIIPKKKQTVVVSGNVMFDTEVPYKKGKSLKYYLKNAGGTSDKGWLKKVYVVHANGSASSSSSFLGFKSYPKILPGSKIIVPEKPEKSKMTTGEIIGISSILTSLAGILLAVFK
nr:SLBB domain-containing protein [uncultured Flavobacterium sp.]